MRDHLLDTLDRRAFLQTAGCGLLVALAGTPAVGRSAIAVAPVDEVTLQVVVDAATFGPFLPDQQLPGLRVERTGRGGAARMSRQSLMAEFGLSILARSRRGRETRDVLVDFGYSPEVLANNMAMLGSTRSSWMRPFSATAILIIMAASPRWRRG